MKFIKGLIYSGLLGTPLETRAIRSLLRVDRKEKSFLNNDNTLYTGLIDFVREIVGDLYKIEIEDDSVPTFFSIKEVIIPDDYLTFENPDDRLRSYQILAARKAIYRERGIIEIATGGGKTEVAAVIMKYLISNGLAKKAYFVAGTRFLMKQAAARFKLRGLEDVRMFGAGSKFKPASVQCCVIDSLRNSIVNEKLGAPGEVLDDFNKCDIIFFEECHHLSADSWIDIGESCPAKYRYGLTATVWSDPFKYSHKDFYLIGLTGSLVAHVPSSVLKNHGWLATPVVTMIKVRKSVVPKQPWPDTYHSGIVEHKARNSIILSLTKSLYEGKYKSLIFVKEINHGLLLVKSLVENGCKNVYFVMGGEMIYTWLPSGRWKRNNTSIEKLSELVRDSENIAIVGNTVLDEGIDIPSFNALIMASAMKKYRRTIQRAGRGMRPKKGLNKVFIFDFIDAFNSTLLKHSVYRMETYKLEEYEFSESLDDVSKEMNVKLSTDLIEYKYSWVRYDKQNAKKSSRPRRHRQFRRLSRRVS